MNAYIYKILSVSFSIFIVMDPFGNLPLFIYFLKGLSPKKQKYIVCRELILALFIIITFFFIGKGILDFLNISGYTIRIAGGIILFIFSLKMLFPKEKEEKEKKEKDPFLVPLAMPLVAGPAVLATIMLYSDQLTIGVVMPAIIIAWVFSLIILLVAPILEKFLKEKGLIAIARLMGFILIMIATQMFLSGLGTFMKTKP